MDLASKEGSEALGIFHCCNSCEAFQNLPKRASRSVLGPASAARTPQFTASVSSLHSLQWLILDSLSPAAGQTTPCEQEAWVRTATVELAIHPRLRHQNPRFKATCGCRRIGSCAGAPWPSCPPLAIHVGSGAGCGHGPAGF